MLHFGVWKKNLNIGENYLSKEFGNQKVVFWKSEIILETRGCIEIAKAFKTWT